jgi:hypothetical protein
VKSYHSSTLPLVAAATARGVMREWPDPIAFPFSIAFGQRRFTAARPQCVPVGDLVPHPVERQFMADFGWIGQALHLNGPLFLALDPLVDLGIGLVGNENLPEIGRQHRTVRA